MGFVTAVKSACSTSQTWTRRRGSTLCVAYLYLSQQQWLSKTKSILQLHSIEDTEPLLIGCSYQ